MRQIVFEYKNKAVETFSPKWFTLSFNEQTKEAVLLDKSSLKARKFSFSRILVNPDEIRLIDVEEEKLGGAFFKPRSKSLILRKTQKNLIGGKDYA